MAVRTNLPGLQVYGAYHLRTAYPGWHAVCLEPENFPDAPNHANFPSSILRPGRDAPVLHELPVQRVTAKIGPGVA